MRDPRSGNPPHEQPAGNLRAGDGGGDGRHRALLPSREQGGRVPLSSHPPQGRGRGTAGPASTGGRPRVPDTCAHLEASS